MMKYVMMFVMVMGSCFAGEGEFESKKANEAVEKFNEEVSKAAEKCIKDLEKELKKAEKKDKDEAEKLKDKIDEMKTFSTESKIEELVGEWTEKNNTKVIIKRDGSFIREKNDKGWNEGNIIKNEDGSYTLKFVNGETRIRYLNTSKKYFSEKNDREFAWTRK